MSQRGVTRFLIAYLVVTWGGVLLRIDHFPLTWAPMFSVHRDDDRASIEVRIADSERRRAGFLATQRDGKQLHVTREDLNLPRGTFGRLLTQRAFGHDANKINHLNASRFGIDAWLAPLSPGPEHPNRQWSLLRSVNATLGREPTNATFIVKLEAAFERVAFDRNDLRKQTRGEHRALLVWDERWSMAVADEPR